MSDHSKSEQQDNKQNSLTSVKHCRGALTFRYHELGWRMNQVPCQTSFPGRGSRCSLRAAVFSLIVCSFFFSLLVSIVLWRQISPKEYFARQRLRGTVSLRRRRARKDSRACALCRRGFRVGDVCLGAGVQLESAAFRESLEPVLFLYWRAGTI